MKKTILIAMLALLLPGIHARAQDDVADVPSDERAIADNAQQKYFLIGLDPTKETPKDGYSLLLVLPGGNGSAEFNPFIRRIWKNALPENFLVAQLVAVSSDRKNQIVWPTEKSKDAKQTFTTESFIANVVKDAQAKTKIADGKVYALAWSSGGPAVYAAMLQEETPLSGGAFVAMSSFFPGQVQAMANAKGRKFYLLQSPADQVTKFTFAKNAQSVLEKNGAKVELVEYAGGHGWRGDVFGMIRAGVEWLARGPLKQEP